MSHSGAGSRFEALFLPAIVAQSLISGGGYATGRETTQYAARFGPQGWLAVGIILVGFSLLGVICYELARLHRTYDYKAFIRLLIGPLWPLFDVISVAMLLLVVSVMSAALSAVLTDTLAMPRGLGELVVFVVVSFAVFRGAAFIERFKTVGSALLYAGFGLFTVLVLATPAPAAVEPVPTVATTSVVVSAIQYVGYNLSVFPSLLFCLYRQTRREETIASGLLSGLSMTLPFALTFLCLIRYWPSDAVLSANVPWLAMLEDAGERLGITMPLVSLFSLVLVLTLLDTAVGGIHALIDRIEHNLTDLPRFLRPREGTLGGRRRALIALFILILTTLLSRFGIIDLVAKGYGAIAWGYIALLALPLVTVGIWRIATAGNAASRSSAG